MTKQSANEKMICVKQALSDKYRSLAAVAKSEMKQRFYSNKAKKYQIQATHLAA